PARDGRLPEGRARQPRRAGSVLPGGPAAAGDRAAGEPIRGGRATVGARPTAFVRAAERPQAPTHPRSADAAGRPRSPAHPAYPARPTPSISLTAVISAASVGRSSPFNSALIAR